MTDIQTENNLPWIEKYRPKDLDALISHEHIIQTIQRFIQQNRLPHLLFYGPPGTGKTSTILSIALQIYSNKQYNSMILELNASDDRGIGVVRDQILNFASTKSLVAGKFKLIILDEVDSMTKDAQNALRRIIEKYTENVRFCLICNYLSKLIPALQSRCTRFRFAPLSPEQIRPRLEQIGASEKVEMTQAGLEALMQLGQGDMRRSINLFHGCSLAFDGRITEQNVYSTAGQPLPNQIRQIFHWLMNESSLSAALLRIEAMKSGAGLAMQDLVAELNALLLQIPSDAAPGKMATATAKSSDCDATASSPPQKIPLEIKAELLEELAEMENRISAGTSERLQLAGLVAVFARCRDRIVLGAK